MKEKILNLSKVVLGFCQMFNYIGNRFHEFLVYTRYILVTVCDNFPLGLEVMLRLAKK